MERIHVSVDEDQCSACGLCQDCAPENIEIPDGGPSAQVVRQPNGDDEIEACVEASDFCPTGGLQVKELAS